MRSTVSALRRICYFVLTIVFLTFGAFHLPAMADTTVNLHIFADGDLPEQGNVVIQALDDRIEKLPLNDARRRGDIGSFNEIADNAIYTKTIHLQNPPSSFNLSLLEIDVGQNNSSQINVVSCRKFRRLNNYLQQYKNAKKLDIDILMQIQYKSNPPPTPDPANPNIYNDYSDCEVTFRINGVDYPTAMPAPAKINLRIFAAGDLPAQGDIIIQTVDGKIRMSPRNDIRKLGDEAPFKELADKPIYARTIEVQHPRSFNLSLVENDVYQAGSPQINVVECRKFHRLDGYLQQYLSNNPTVGELNIDVFMKMQYQPGPPTQSPADPNIFIDNSTCTVTSFKINGVDYSNE
jgi:hypothetical protein